MPNAQLSAQVKKLAKDFSLIDGKIQLSTEKLTQWLETFDKVEAADRPKLGQELIALAIRFERDGKAAAAIGTAQLYACAAGVLQHDGTATGPAAAPKGKGFAPKANSKAAAKPAASKLAAAAKKPAPGKASPARNEKSSGGWGAKSKR
jgi:hypothetical protein